jgi:hypothetical protein
MPKYIPYLLLLLASVFLFENCAKIGSVTGGLKDEDPPELVSSSPANYSTNFTGKRIDVTFDEFITLNNVNQALIVSPPMETKPEVRLKGKSIQINLLSDLLDNTTYTLNFGNAIEDNNERNVLENFEFVFSTGNYLDSLTIEGTLLDAFTLQPHKEPFIIMAYDRLGDSIPMLEAPLYVGRTDAAGFYRINNMKADTFRIFALKDLNFNYRFDLPNEQIAFADSFVYLFPDSLEINDPADLKKDSILAAELELKMPPDSLLKKTRKRKVRETWFKPVLVDLRSFEQESKIQFITDNERKEDRHIFLSFNLPLEKDPEIRGLNFDEDDWFIMEPGMARDTFTLWIKDSMVYHLDTISLEIAYPALDSMAVLFTQKDTLDFIIRRQQEVKGKVQPDTAAAFIISTIANNTRQDLHRNIPLETKYPLADYDRNKIELFHIPDSIEFPMEYKITRDSISYRKYYINLPWISKGKYRLYIEPGAFTDIYGNVNDTVNVSFNIQDVEYYGTLIQTISNVQTPIIIQLMNEKEVVLDQRFVDKNTKVEFPYLRPARYIVKYIFDENRNGKWDTGNYLLKQQPEKSGIL